MNSEHNEEVQLMASLQMWGRHRAMGLGAEEGHQDGPEIQQVPGRASEKIVPGRASGAWAHAGAQAIRGGLPHPADADELGQNRHRFGDQAAVGNKEQHSREDMKC